MSPASSEELVLARQACGITQDDLWMRYFALGGMGRPVELDAIVHDALRTTAADRDLVVLALNERFAELGRPPSIPYSDEPRDAPDELGDAGAESAGPTDEAEPADAAAHAELLQRAVDALADRDSSLFRRLAQAQHQHAYRDTLTGVLPRDAGQDQLQRAVDHAHRTAQPLMVVFLDVDDLKRTNDTQGHAAGDLLLKALGVALRRRLRSYDVVVRYGGDEFVCGLPHAGLAQATGRVDQVSAQLDAAVPGASVTAGFAALREDDSLEDVLRRADEDMYSNRGRRHSGLSGGDHAAAKAVDALRAPWRARLSHLLRVAIGRERRA